jgi:thioredoxin
MSGKVKELSDTTFKDVVGSGVTLVDFWATWCPPCRMQSPIIEKVADSLDARAVVAKIDVDANPATASQYGVSSIPTLIVFKNGKEVKRFVGLQQEPELVSAVSDNLA